METLRLIKRAAHVLGNYGISELTHKIRAYRGKTCDTYEEWRRRYGQNEEAIDRAYLAEPEYAPEPGALPETKPKVSILIPNKDHVEDLKKCIESIGRQVKYENYEVIILENNSEEEATAIYYAEIVEKEMRIKVRNVETKGFNFAHVCNEGAYLAEGDILLFLNNDTELATDIITEMLPYAVQPKTGAVGAWLYYPDKTVQHAGVVMNLNGIAAHAFKGIPRHGKTVGENQMSKENEDLVLRAFKNRREKPYKVSAVTAACLMIKKDLYKKMGGMDEKHLAVEMNDVDLCLRLMEQGYENVVVPAAEAIHYESKSRGTAEDAHKKDPDREAEAKYILNRHPAYFQAGDPYYSRYYSKKLPGFMMRE